jgi:carboxyl-terminal processing protease
MDNNTQNNDIKLDQENIDAYMKGSNGEILIHAEPADTPKKASKGKTSDAGKFLLGVITGAAGVAFGVLIAIIIVTAVTKKENTNPAEGFITENVMTKAAYLRNLVKNAYYEDVTDEELVEGIYRGIVAATGDKYSTYYSLEEIEVSRGDWEGKFYGIGATLTTDPDTGYGLIDSVMKDSPAEKAGVKAGDIIYRIDGEETYGMTLTEIVSLVRGDDGTEVVLDMVRDGKEIPITVIRGEVTETHVYYEKKEDGIGYIIIAEFSDIAYEQFVEAIDKAKADKVKGLVLDLRGNPGGDMITCVKMCREIMPEGLIVYTEDKLGSRQDYFCDGSKYWDIPMAVLTNGGTASAAEIMTAALQDTQMATVVGKKTYGKGVYQNVYALPDGSAAKITAGRFFSPNGICFHGTGITPDVDVDVDYEAYEKDKTDTQLEKALEVVRNQIEQN